MRRTFTCTPRGPAAQVKYRLHLRQAHRPPALNIETNQLDAEFQKVQTMNEEDKQPDEAGSASETVAFDDSDAALTAEPLCEEVSFDEFVKVDLRVARVVAAEEVPEARKLLKLTLSLGGDVRRQVFAGIKQAYRPEQLVGRLVIMAANLAPRKMKFGISEGMILASGSGGADVFMLGVDEGAVPGQRVH